MNSASGLPVRRIHVDPDAATACAVIVSVLAGFTELNTGQDSNAALMVWFFFAVSAGLVLQLAGVKRFVELLRRSSLPALAFVCVQLAGAYFYGIPQFSAMTWDLSVEAALRMLALFAVTTLMIATVAKAGPIIQHLIAAALRLTSERAAQIVATISGLGSIVAALVVLYTLIVLKQGASIQ